jgi:UDP-glucose 4-epimerase
MSETIKIRCLSAIKFLILPDKESKMKKRILVTGGTGYIGSHTVVELQQAGYEVVIVDDLSNSNIDVLDNIEKITGIKPEFENFDLADSAKTVDFFQRNSGIEAIIHFAAFKAVGESVEKPLLYYRNNLVSMMNLLECQLKYDVQHMVFSSSCTVYGQPDKLPVTEDTPRKDAESPYGNTKRVNEDILYDTIAAHPQLRGISLRYFNPIGAHPSALIGELPLGVPQNLVPFITQTAAGIRKELKVFGDDYHTPDGSAIRDYINVVDLAKAHVIAIERLLKKKYKQNYEVFNLGTGTGVSVLEMVKGFVKATGVNINYKIVDRRAGDVEKIWADTIFANEELGWKAEKGLEETLLSAWNWEKRVRRIE